MTSKSWNVGMLRTLLALLPDTMPVEVSAVEGEHGPRIGGGKVIDVETVNLDPDGEMEYRDGRRCFPYVLIHSYDGEV